MVLLEHFSHTAFVIVINILLMKCSLPTHGLSCLPEIINYISMNEKGKEYNATCASWKRKRVVSDVLLTTMRTCVVNRRTDNMLNKLTYLITSYKRVMLHTGIGKKCNEARKTHLYLIYYSYIWLNFSTK